MTLRPHRPVRRPLLVLVALAVLAPAIGLGQAKDGARVFSRTYEFRVLEHDAAEALAWEACEAGGGGPDCLVQSSSPRSLTVLADTGTHARIAAAIAAAEDVPGSQLFQVVLLQAENNGDAGLEKVPPGARAALQDARAFLPFSGYKLLGSALLRTDSHARSIVNGPDGLDYSAALTYQNAAGRDGHRLIVRQFALDRLASARPGSEESIERIPVIGTSFGMKPGETVIVGTSKLEGSDRALVVLLTNVQ